MSIFMDVAFVAFGVCKDLSGFFGWRRHDFSDIWLTEILVHLKLRISDTFS